VIRRSARTRAKAAGLAAAAALLAGCGSTVQASSVPTSSDGALGAPGTSSTNGLSAPAAGLSGSVGNTPGATGANGISSATPGSVSTTSPDGATTTATAPQASVHAGSVSTRAPITIGFIVTNASNAGSYGINAGQTYTDQQLYDALVAAMNKRGGLNGRKIVPVYGVTDTAAPNWSTQFQAACAKFTQDNHVAAVLGYIFVFMDSFESCLARAGVPHLYGGYQPGDVEQQRKYPTLVGTTAPTSDIHWRVGLGGAVETGLLTPKNKLGVLVDACANDNAAFDRFAPQYLKAHHITYERFDVGCAAGASDNGAAASQIQSAELQFRADGVDTVWVEGVPALVFAEDAESQAWHPSYLMMPAGAAFEGNVPNDQLANFHGFGVIPAVDVDPQHQPYKPNASEKRCLDMLAEQGLHPKGYNDYFEAYTTCDSLFLYDAALLAAGGQTAAGPVVSALASVFGKTLLASTYNGVGRYIPEQHGGPGVWRQWGWAKSCSCFQYVGPTHPVG